VLTRETLAAVTHAAGRQISSRQGSTIPVRRTVFIAEERSAALGDLTSRPSTRVEKDSDDFGRVLVHFR
jgi:hypothetical protein